MLPKRIEQFLIFFDVFGFNSGASKLSKCRGIFYCIEFVHILIATFFTLTKFKFLIGLYSLNGAIPTVNELLQYSAGLYPYWLIIVDSICGQSSHKQFWKLFQQIDRQFCSQSNLCFRIYLVKMIEFFAATTLISAIGMMDLIKKCIVYSYIFLAKFSNIRIFYYLFCLKMINFQLKHIEEELENMHKSNVADCQRLKWIREYVSLVHEMTYHLNNTFGWSNAAVILCCFYYVLVGLNWIIIMRFSMNNFICEFGSI